MSSNADNDWSLERLIKDRQSEESKTRVQQERSTFPTLRPLVIRMFPKRPNWFVCLFSKKKREERKKWDKKWDKIKFDKIKALPMVYGYESEVPYLDFVYHKKEQDQIHDAEQNESIIIEHEDNQ